MTVLTVAEHCGGRLCDVSREAQTAGRELAEATGDPVHTAVVGDDAEQVAEGLARDGVDTIHTVPGGDGFNHDVYVQTLSQLAASVDARAVLVPHTATGLDYAPALAVRLDWPVVTDAVALHAADGLAVTRELDGASTTLAVDGGRAVVTLRSGEWPPEDGTGETDVVPFAADVDDEAVRSTMTGHEALTDPDLAEADVVVAVGRGIGAEAHLDAIFDLADAVGGTVAAASPPVKRGWVSAERLVGHSGVTVAPDVYLAIGISGAAQHLAGMRESDTVVAVNSDPTAPIFDVADYGVVADLFDIVPELIAEFHPDDG